jgi:3-methyladenine DNA glycosylase AlkD
MLHEDVMAELESFGSEPTKKTLTRHGAREPFFGVKVQDLKKIQKRIMKDHELSLSLFATGNSDAMYLAGLIAEPMKMTKPQLQKWVKGAYWHMVSCYTVAWVTAESRFARELSLEWIDSPKEQVSSAGWSTYSSWISIQPDEKLDFDEILELLDRVEREIPSAPNRTKYCMNQFVICVGSYVAPLLPRAKATAKKLGKVVVDVGDTNCKVPDATAYIAKIESMGRIGQKRKTAIC